MSYSLFDFLTLMGSLGLFLFGMKLMSEGIQKVAGEKMRNILSAMTGNRFSGIGTGFLITTLVQSSSATTVMIISFVNAGLLTLVEAIGVIMGANIGTTITAWIIAILGFKVKMGAIAVPLIAFGFGLLFFKRDKLRSLGELIIGFSLIFIGLDFLKASVPDLQSSPEMFEFLKDMGNFGLLSTLIFIGIGTLLTVLLQSSSAAIALTLVLCFNGWIDFQSGAAIVLGENIGTTITANIAALIGNVHAKRAALAHTLFNLIGIFWMFFIFKFVLELIDKSLVMSGFQSPFLTYAGIPLGLSVFHSSFNVINTLLLVGFVKYIARFVEKVISARSVKDEEFHLEYIGTGLLNTSELSLMEVRKEVVKFGEITHRMFGFIQDIIENEKEKKEFNELLERIEKYEDITDRMEVEIASFLIQLSQNEISLDASRSIRGILRAISNMEKIGDLCYHMSISIKRNTEDGLKFTPRQKQNLKDMFHLLDISFGVMENNVSITQETIDMSTVNDIENKINALRDKIRNQHFGSIEKGDYNIKTGLYYNNIYSSCEKIGDHLFNISEAMSGHNIE
jgi:phosphate:Na+ symporter